MRARHGWIMGSCHQFLMTQILSCC